MKTRVRARRMVLWTALLTTIAAAVGACGGGDGLMRPRHLVLVTLDTTRADHLSAYGYDLSTSPWLDRLAAHGVVFRHAFSQSATTKPSHATLFTSLYPIQHGVQNNTLVLEDRFLTLAEVMAAQGYRTAAFIGADAPLGGNVRQGFEVWNEPGGVDDRNARGHKAYRPAAETVDEAIAWLDAEADPAEDLFLWVHVYDAHKPLRPPHEVRQEVAGMIARVGAHTHKGNLEAQGIPASSRSGWYRRTIDYDAEIRYADAQLGRLFEHMQSVGYGDRSLWIVTADHGEGLGSHDRWGHSVHIYNAQLHVPLVFWFSDGSVAPRSIDDTVVELTDVLPTVTDLFAIGNLDQVMPMQGRSLLPYLRGSAPRQRRRFAYSERSRYLGSRQRQSKGNYENGSRYAYQDLQYKYLLFTEGVDELYDLRSDPRELANLIDQPEQAQESEQMRELLASLVAETRSDAAPASVSKEEVQRLRALGYIQ